VNSVNYRTQRAFVRAQNEQEETYVITWGPDYDDSLWSSEEASMLQPYDEYFKKIKMLLSMLNILQLSQIYQDQMKD
jgi:hypothetical protein